MTIMDTGRAKIGTNYSYSVQGDDESNESNESNDATVTATTNDTATATGPIENTGVPVATPPAGTANTGVPIYGPTLAYYENNSETLKNIDQQKKRTRLLFSFCTEYTVCKNIMKTTNGMPYGNGPV
jgi:hypothetical protein